MGSPAFAALTETAPGAVITATTITNTKKQVNTTDIVVLARLALAHLQSGCFMVSVSLNLGKIDPYGGSGPTEDVYARIWPSRI